MTTLSPGSQVSPSSIFESWDDLNGNPLRIWFNQTYGTNYWIAQLLKDNPEGVPVQIITSSDRPESPVLLAGDEVYMEPLRSELSGDAYVDWALDFCVKNAVKLFIPMREIANISGRKAEFNAAGVAVLGSPKESIDLLEDKNLAYISARENGIPVPPWRIAAGEQQFRDAYVSLHEEIEGQERICIKPVAGVGAEGFRMITDKKPSIKNLINHPGFDIELSVLLDILKRTEDAGEAVPELMLMPYLAEPEVSVDCLSDLNGNILAAIPRSKRGKFQDISADDYQSIEIATAMVKTYKLSHLTNTQVRWFRGEPVLLETNARISGGMYASQFAGLNMPWEGVKLALFGKIDGPLEVKFGATYTSVPSVIRIA